MLTKNRFLPLLLFTNLTQMEALLLLGLVLAISKQFIILVKIIKKINTFKTFHFLFLHLEMVYNITSHTYLHSTFIQYTSHTLDIGYTINYTLINLGSWQYTLLLNEGIPRAYRGKKLRLKNILFFPSKSEGITCRF